MLTPPNEWTIFDGDIKEYFTDQSQITFYRYHIRLLSLKICAMINHLDFFLPIIAQLSSSMVNS